MNKRIWAFFIALLISFTYILPSVPVRAESAGVLGASSEADDTGADIPGESEEGEEIPEAMEATPTSAGAFIASPAAEIPQSGLIDSYDKLREQLDEGATELELGAVITIPSDEFIDFYGESPIHIRTGEYGLIVEGYAFIGENVVISGDGVSNAVVELKNGGSITVLDAAFEKAPSITATESGGTALSIHSSGGYLINLSSYLKINSNNGIGVRSDAPLELIGCFIDAGSGRGIVGTEEVSLFLCRVEGGDKAVDAPAVFADTSVFVSGGEPKYSSIRRTFTLGSGRLVLNIGEAIPDELYEPLYIGMYLSAEGAEDLEVYRIINLNMPEMDTSASGTYYAAIRTDKWMELCGLAPDEAAAYTIAVRDLRIPAFQSTEPFFGHLFFRYTGGDLDSLILWRSDDEGQSWWDATDSSAFDFMGDDQLLLMPEIEEGSVWFVWEAKGIGESEILRVTFKDGDLDGNPGGDRTGGDRGESDPPPDNTSPDSGQPTTPPTNPSGGGQTSTSDDSSDGRGTSTPDSLAANRQDAGPGTQMANPQASGVQLSAPPMAKAAPPLEFPDESGVVLSGQRLLAMMAANPGHVTFLNDGLWVSIPTDYLLGLGIADRDTFYVYLERPNEDSFSVSFLLGGRELPAFTQPFMVSLPWDGGTVFCVAEDETVTEAQLADGKATFALYRTGTFRLMPGEQIVPVSAPIQSTPPIDLTADTAVPEHTAPVAFAEEATAPYRDSILPILAACGLALAAAAAYAGFSRKRRAGK